MTLSGIRSSVETLINNLSTELLESIFEYICNTSPSTLLSLTLVNKFFYRLAYAFKNRHQTFTFLDLNVDEDNSSRKSKVLIKSLLDDTSKLVMLNSIRSITIENKLSYRYDLARVLDADEVKWGPLVKVIGRLSYLKYFTFYGPTQIPVMLLDALEKHHPRAKLHVRNWGRIRDGEDHNNAAELALARSPNLRAIQARFWDTNDHYDLRIAALKRVVALSPNLEEVDIATGASGCVIRTLSLEDYEEEKRRGNLFEVEPSSNSIKSLRTRGGYHVDALDGATDVSKLKRLDVNEIHERFFEKDRVVNARFQNLTHLSVVLNDSWESSEREAGVAFESFLASCKPLQSLEIRNRMDTVSISTIISSHGQSLKRLVLHETESSSRSYLQKSLTFPEAQEIGRGCPLLQDFTFDAEMVSSAEPFQESFAFLGFFPNLSIIRIYVPLGIAEEAARTPWIFLDDDEVKVEAAQHKKNPFSPLQDPCWLENTWNLLRREKQKRGTPPLKELHVKVGEWEREMGGGYPAAWIIWEASNRRYIIAKPSERDDRPDYIVIRTMQSGQGGPRDEGTVEIRTVPPVNG